MVVSNLHMILMSVRQTSRVLNAILQPPVDQIVVPFSQLRPNHQTAHLQQVLRQIEAVAEDLIARLRGNSK